jgi:electron transfer flavoprotein beta subunit
MRIVVCMKQVLDPEMPNSSFRIDPEGRRAVPPQGVPPVLSPYDENALEAALRLKDEHGSTVIVVSAGARLARPVLRKALAAGADEMVLIEDPALESADSFAAAGVLAAAIRRIGDVDLVFTGRQAADWDAGITGCAIAEDLGIPCVTVARKVDVGEENVTVERVVSDGFEVVEARIPCVITVDSDLGELRQTTLQGLSAAQKKLAQVWTLSDLDMDSPPPTRCDLLGLFIPERTTVCEIIEGTTAEDTAVRLADRLHDESAL